MPRQLRAWEIPGSPQPICLRRAGGPAPHPVGPPLRGLLATPLPLLVLAFAALAPSRPEPAPSPRSGQAPGRPVQKNRPAKPRTARPRRDRRVPPRQARARRPVPTVSPDSSPASGGSSALPDPLGVSRWSLPVLRVLPRMPALRALPKSPARSPETPLRPVPGPPAQAALPQRPQRNRLPSAHGPRPGTARGRPPLDPAEAVRRPTLPTRFLPGARARRTRPLWLGAPTGMANIRPGALPSPDGFPSPALAALAEPAKSAVRAAWSALAVAALRSAQATLSRPRDYPGFAPAAVACTRPLPAALSMRRSPAPSGRLPRPGEPFRSPPILGLLGQAPESASMGTLPRNPAGPSASRWLHAARARPAA